MDWLICATKMVNATTPKHIIDGWDNLGRKWKLGGIAIWKWKLIVSRENFQVFNFSFV